MALPAQKAPTVLRNDNLSGLTPSSHKYESQFEMKLLIGC